MQYTKCRRPWVLIVAAAVVAAFAALAAATDLSEVYPATRSWSAYGLVPVSTAEDVWIVSSFEISTGRSIHIRSGPATVVFGRDGTDVLWAVVLPDEPPAITGALAPEGERAQSILVRFAPSEIGRVFPKRTVEGRGDGWRRHEAQRIASRKMVWRWRTSAGNPTIVPQPIVIVDVDTVEGPRRFWAIDREARQVERIDEYTDEPTPPMRSIDSAAALAAFDEVWSAFDQDYAKFVDLPHVDWEALRGRYRAIVETIDTTFMLAAAMADMLAHLEDLHVWVRDGEEVLSGYWRPRPLNGNWIATRDQLVEHHAVGNDLVWGRTADGIGYLGVHRLADADLPKHVDAALEALRDTKGMVIDLRFNGGGDELLARAVAGRFASERIVYSKNQYRSGPKRDDLGPVLERALEPCGPWRYEAPLVCLFGQRTFSSAESMAAMFAHMPEVITMGSPTGGSSANPRQLSLDCGMTVSVPRWRDMLPDGTPIEGRGVRPQRLIEHEPDAFTNERDPVFEKALDALRERSQSLGPLS